MTVLATWAVAGITGATIGKPIGRMLGLHQGGSALLGSGIGIEVVSLSAALELTGIF